MNEMETMKKNLEAINAEASELVDKWNSAYSAEKIDFAKITKLDIELGKKLEEYAELKRKIVFTELLSTDDPMIAACEMLSYPILSKKEGKKGASKIPTRELSTKNIMVDIRELNKQAEHGIGHDPEWIDKAQVLNLRLTLNVAKSLELSAEERKVINQKYAGRVSLF